MVNAITRSDEIFLPSRVEIDRGGLSYTVDTLAQLVEQYNPDIYELFYIIGIDALEDMVSWKEPGRIIELTHIAVMQRPGFNLPKLPSQWVARVVLIETPQIDISSTLVKDRIQHNQPIRMLVGDAVSEIIQRYGLYK